MDTAILNGIDADSIVTNYGLDCNGKAEGNRLYSIRIPRQKCISAGVFIIQKYQRVD